MSSDAGQRLRREPAAARRRGLGELRAQHVGRLPHPHLAEDARLRIDHDERRPVGGGDGERLLLLRDAHACGARRATSRSSVSSKHAGTPSVVACVCLAATVSTPLSHETSDVDLGVPGLVDPLLEEAPKAPAAHLFEGALQVARLDHAARVAGEVGAHAVPEQRVAELDAQHVQHEPPFS